MLFDDFTDLFLTYNFAVATDSDTWNQFIEKVRSGSSTKA